MTPSHSFRVTQPLEYKTRFHPWHLFRGDFLHAIRLFNHIAKAPFALTSHTVPIFPFLIKQGARMLGPQIRTSQFGLLFVQLWPLFDPWSPPPYTFPSSISKQTVRLLRCRLDHSKAVTSSTHHRCYKEICAFVFCIVEILSVHNKRYDCMGD